MHIRLLSEAHVRSVMPTLPEVLELIEESYRRDAEGQAEAPTKIGVHPTTRANSFLHAMPAWVGGAQALGMKWISYFPGNFDRGIPDSTGIVILNHPEHGLPCCIMEGMYLTFLRTAACAAIAAKYLVAQAPKTLGLIGCGGLGRWSLHLLSAMFPSIEQVFVSSRRRETREAFCAEMQPEGRWKIAPVAESAEAVRGMDIVVTSIPPGGVRPVNGRDLNPGAVLIPLDIITSWHDDVPGACGFVVADDPAHFVAQVKAKRPAAFPTLKTPLRTQDLVAGRSPRPSPTDRSIAAVCGIATTDVVVGWEIYRRACAKNIGVEFDIYGST
jgi:ornithine cyclodeaminase/alanine dehydrogenase-like protein (mu-crystallin family)